MARAARTWARLAPIVDAVAAGDLARAHGAGAASFPITTLDVVGPAGGRARLTVSANITTITEELNP